MAESVASTAPTFKAINPMGYYSDIYTPQSRNLSADSNFTSSNNIKKKVVSFFQVRKMCKIKPFLSANKPWLINNNIMWPDAAAGTQTVIQQVCC